MKSVRNLLQEADPLQHEPLTSAERDFRRQALLEAASGARAPAGVRSRSRIRFFVTVALAVIAISFLGSRMRSPFVSDLQAAVRFEVRLAEDKPAPGLRAAKISGSSRSVYLHDEVILNNGDIAAARAIPGGTAQFSISVEFSASGAEKMRRATANHIGKPVAILLDGQVVMTPVVRVPIGGSAVITGNFTKAEAERIVNGVRLR